MNARDIEYIIDTLREILPEGKEGARLSTLTKREILILRELCDVIAVWLGNGD